MNQVGVNLYHQHAVVTMNPCILFQVWPRFLQADEAKIRKNFVELRQRGQCDQQINITEGPQPGRVEGGENRTFDKLDRQITCGLEYQTGVMPQHRRERSSLYAPRGPLLDELPPALRHRLGTDSDAARSVAPCARQPSTVASALARLIIAHVVGLDRRRGDPRNAIANFLRRHVCLQTCWQAVRFDCPLNCRG